MKNNNNKKKNKNRLIKNYDLTGDGKISESELIANKKLIDLDIKEKRATTQKKMAWVSMITMIVFTVLLFSPLISDTRVAALSELLGLFYLANSGIVGAYMGFQTWMSKGRK